MMRIQSFQISIFQYYRFNNEGYIITSRMECTSYNISNMGNQCCSDRTADGELKNACTTNDLLDNENDQPSTSFARLVNQHIDLHPKVKQTYYIYKPHHSSERKGAKLPLYYIYNYCAYYEGQWKNGKPHGYGRMVYDDGSLYEGCFRNGAADCKQALFVRDSSTFYKGSIKNNKANGYGQLATPKMFYKGYWVDDLPQGKARQIYSSASFYEGNFINGEKQGDGIYQWNKNEYYIGKFSKNMFNGQGDLTTKEFYYRGLFKDGKREGKGCYRDNVSKFVYTGNFQNNRPFGNGQIVYEDGSTITGQFDGFENIKGLLTVKTGLSVTLHVTPENTKILNIDKK